VLVIAQRRAAGLDRLDKFGAGGEREIITAPKPEPLGVGEVVHRGGAGRRDVEDAGVWQRVLQAQAGAALIVTALADLEHGRLVAVPQAADGVLYAAKIDKAEARIDFTRNAAAVHNHIRGLSPFPGAWFEAVGPAGTVERIKVLRSEPVEERGAAGTVLTDDLVIACGFGAVRIIEAQRAGKRPMLAAEFLRGFPLVAGATVNQS